MRNRRAGGRRSLLRSFSSALRTDAMPTIDIRGTSVAFPFKPYDCQLKYIGGVLEALDDSVRQFLNFSLSLAPAA